MCLHEHYTPPLATKLCEFRCRTGECLLIEQRCDGIPDCDDRFDELDCRKYAGALSLDTACYTPNAYNQLHSSSALVEPAIDENTASIRIPES